MKKIKMTETWIDPQTMQQKTRTKTVHVPDDYSPKQSMVKMKQALHDFKKECEAEQTHGRR